MIKVNVITNEWYFTYDLTTRNIITVPEFIDKNTSAVVADNIGVESFKTEDECEARIAELKLIMPEQILT